MRKLYIIKSVKTIYVLSTPNTFITCADNFSCFKFELDFWIMETNMLQFKHAKWSKFFKEEISATCVLNKPSDLQSRLPLYMSGF